MIDVRIWPGCKKTVKKKTDKPMSVVRSRIGRKSRAEKTQETRRRLLHSASELIGEEGYARATIAKITSRADLSLGTFYTYFQNREDLFDQLLPQMGDEMLSYVRHCVAGITDPLAQEEAGLHAFFDFMSENPGFYRLLNEAETVVPHAYEKHFKNISSGYVRALKRHKAAGHLPGYEVEEFETLVYMLMAARNYLVMRYGPVGQDESGLRSSVVQTYMKFVSGGLQYGASGEIRSVVREER